MMSNNLFIISILHCSLIIIITCCILQQSSAGNANYAACSSLYSCGPIQNVGYPFWGESRPKSCGIPDLKLNCDSHPTLLHPSTINIFESSDIEVSVLGINATSHTLVYSLDYLVNFCIAGRNPTILATLELEVPAAIYRKIQVFYGCDDDCVSNYRSIKSFTCSSSSTYSDDGIIIGTAYYFGNRSSEISKSCSCRNDVSLPVDVKGFVELSSTNSSLLNILMRQQIQTNYKANFTACSMCEKSGGICGSSEDPSSEQFVCYCSNGSQQPILCPGTKQGWPRYLKFIISGIAALILAMVMLVALVFCNAKMRPNTNIIPFQWSRKFLGDQNVETFIKNYANLALKRYTFANVTKMTNSFKEKLGEGGYGSVYKGKLPDGRLVAVKKMKKLKGDGKDFINEVLSISRANHVNIVTLLGFCVEGTKRALIFEFLPNGSLEKFMYGKEIGQPLHWDTMLNIALGIARGLDYLHRGCTTRILHFDIKPHNILLDEDFCPKISDFGLARLCSPKNSMISMSDARGTIGYIAPEVFCRNFGGVSHKSDVYSFGMMLLDLICGRNNLAANAESSSDMYFPDWIYNQLEPINDDAEVTIQETTAENEEHKRLKRKMILVSLWCIQAYPSNRPPISRVVEMLEGPLDSLQMPPKPLWSSSVPHVSDSSSTLQSLATKDNEDIQV